MARKFTLEGARVLIVDKADDILDGASKGNSAILHTGFDAPPPGTQEHHCLTRGYEEYLRLHRDLSLPLDKCGALVIAWSNTEAEKLEELRARAIENGVNAIRLLRQSKLFNLEPNLSSKARAALHIPGESIIDPWSAPYAYLLQALINGAKISRNCEVTDGSFDDSHWNITTTKGMVKASHVINCAGLYGDQINQMFIGESDFVIEPRRGEFLVFDKSARPLIQSILLPVPNEITKGIVVCPTIFGNILVGPTAETQSDRQSAKVNQSTLQELYQTGLKILPELKNHTVTATYAGLRPATEHKDYQISHDETGHYTCVGGIRSTGLSAALGIAEMVFKDFADSKQNFNPIDDIHLPITPVLSETMERDWQFPDNQGIVCHCEHVTRREILSALNGPLAARSLAGVKRRTRATMGRCQGFYCTAELEELTRNKLDVPLSVSDD